MLPGGAPLDDALGGNLRDAQDDEGAALGGAPLDDALGGNLRSAQDDEGVPPGGTPLDDTLGNNLGDAQVDDGAAQDGNPLEQADAASELPPDLFDLPVGSLRDVLGLDPPPWSRATRISRRTFPRIWTFAPRRLVRKSVGRSTR